MGIIRDVRFVKPICGITFTADVSLNKVIEQVEPLLGIVEDQTPVFDFTFTDYYREEMGENLSKLFLSFNGLIHPGRLPEIKHKTNGVEQDWSVSGKRRVNLDPGYITGAKLVLASTKDFAHRIFLADAIYGDVQLRFRQDRFRSQEWTYPDYKTESALAFFGNVRDKYILEEKEHAKEDTV
jgi:hypothetical protein